MTVLNINRHPAWCLCLFALLCSTVLNAQDAVVKELAREMTDSLTYLKLTESQKEKAMSLNEVAAADFLKLAEKVQADPSISDITLCEQIIGIMKQRNNGLKPTLTPEQRKLFDEHRVYKISELQTQIMAAELDLTDQQIPEVYQINLEQTAKMLKDVDKNLAADKQNQKAKASKELEKDFAEKDKEMKEVLSEDQYNIYVRNKESIRDAIRNNLDE